MILLSSEVMIIPIMRRSPARSKILMKRYYSTYLKVGAGCDYNIFSMLEMELTTRPAM